MNKNDFVSVAKVLGFHGINGEVRVGYSQGQESKLSSTKEFYVQVENEFVSFKVSSIRFHKKYVLIKFKNINSINDAENLKNQSLYLKRVALDALLEQDEFFVSDLVGMDAFSFDDELIGTVGAVTTNGATDILVIKSNKENKEFLVPFVKDLVPEIDKQNKKILINNIEGLLE